MQNQRFLAASMQGQILNGYDLNVRKTGFGYERRVGPEITFASTQRMKAAVRTRPFKDPRDEYSVPVDG
jgi:hypothetical protein